MTTLSLEASKKVFEIVGEYETERDWELSFDKRSWFLTIPEEYLPEDTMQLAYCRTRVPAPNFAELVRVLPKIGEKKKWNAGWGRSGTCLIDVLYNVSIIYMNAPTEPEGMAAVETYLMKLL